MFFSKASFINLVFAGSGARDEEDKESFYGLGHASHQISNREANFGAYFIQLIESRVKEEDFWCFAAWLCKEKGLNRHSIT